jgi:hypothetical protein
MMKKNNIQLYSDISSFEDFHREKGRLILKSKLIESRLELRFLIIKQVFSLSNLITSLSKEYILPRLSEFLEGFLKRTEEKTDS